MGPETDRKLTERLKKPVGRGGLTAEAGKQPDRDREREGDRAGQPEVHQ
jgi:hypothetical protein